MTTKGIDELVGTHSCSLFPMRRWVISIFLHLFLKLGGSYVRLYRLKRKTPAFLEGI